ncbi:hypothetical protein [Streptomyces natalensis]|uniref:hypothetical protein n=1 Tax=Streptomyces natalensis TaxID=68242 RepID=UPI000CED04C4|nr:hypothetical protein [Streptomyces natalensis]
MTPTSLTRASCGRSAAVAEYLGYRGPSATGSARKQFHRWGIVAEARDGKQATFPADQIIAAQKHRPGAGAHTDLKP